MVFSVLTVWFASDLLHSSPDCGAVEDIKVIDHYPESISSGLTNSFQELAQDKNADLAQTLVVKKRTRVILITDIDASVRIINVYIGSMFELGHTKEEE